jgi:uncharacterized membrane protein
MNFKPLNQAETLIQEKLERISKQPWPFLAIIISLNILMKSLYADYGSLWLDEASQILMSLETTKDIILHSLRYPNAPIFTIILGYWMDLFGHGVFAARFLSILFSVATIPVLFFLAKRHFNVFTAVFACLLFSVSHLQFYYSHEIRSYTLVSLLVTASFFIFLEIMKRPSWIKTIFLIIINSILLYTHLTSIFIFVAQGIYLLFYFKSPVKLFQGLLSIIIPLFLLSFWVINNSWLERGGTVWLPIPKPTDFVNMFLVLGNKGLSLILLLTAIISVVYFIIHKSYLGIKKETIKKVIILAMWLIVPVLLLYITSLLYNPRFIHRYVLYSSIALYLLIPYIASHKKFPLILKVLLLFAFIAYSFHKLNIKTPKDEDWAGFSVYYKDIKTDNSITVVSANYQWISFSYYYNRDLVVEHKDTRNVLKNENIFFINSINELNKLDLADKDKIILVLCHYNVVDPEHKILNFLSENYNESDESKKFQGIQIHVFRSSDD